MATHSSYSKDFKCPRPLRSPEAVMALNGSERWEVRPVNMPEISNAGYKVLGRLYWLSLHPDKSRGYRQTGGTPRALCTEWRCLKKLIDAKLVNDHGSYVTLNAQGRRWYEVEYYRRLYEFKLWKQRKHGTPIDMSTD